MHISIARTLCVLTILIIFIMYGIVLTFHALEVITFPLEFVVIVIVWSRLWPGLVIISLFWIVLTLIRHASIWHRI